MLGELNEDEIERLLAGEVIGRIGCHAEGRVYVVPVTYAYSTGAAYCHSGDGLKIALMRKNPNVCFEVEHIDDLTNWRSVIAQGRFEELAGESAERGMRILVDRVLPLIVSQTTGLRSAAEVVSAHRRDTATRHAVVFRIVLAEKTGRFERR